MAYIAPAKRAGPTKTSVVFPALKLRTVVVIVLTSKKATPLIESFRMVGLLKRTCVPSFSVSSTVDGGSSAVSCAGLIVAVLTL